jgi:hypothetical protein
MKLSIYLVDAFSAKPYGGNPAAIVLLTQPLDDQLRQLIAREMNQSETAFVEPVSLLHSVHAPSEHCLQLAERSSTCHACPCRCVMALTLPREGSLGKPTSGCGGSLPPQASMVVPVKSWGELAKLTLHPDTQPACCYCRGPPVWACHSRLSSRTLPGAGQPLTSAALSYTEWSADSVTGQHWSRSRVPWRPPALDHGSTLVSAQCSPATSLPLLH